MRSCKLCLLFCFAVVPAHISRAAAAQPGQPPNIILILADDLGAADLGCCGADLHETPRIDRLAAEGLRFTQAYASAPVCLFDLAADRPERAEELRERLHDWREEVGAQMPSPR